MTHEVVSALILLVHGALWLAPPETFPLSGNYAVMASIAPENVWGAAFLLFGAALLWVGVSFWMSNPQTIVGWVLIIVAAGTFVTRIELR